MKHTSIKLSDFIDKNGISTYFLPRDLKSRITSYRQDLQRQYDKSNENNPEENIVIGLTQKEQKILRGLKSHLIQRVKRNANNDNEILIALKRVKWTKYITEEDLRKMGLEASLVWNTTILGKLKLVRIAGHVPVYFLLPFGKNLDPSEAFPFHRIRKHTIINPF